MIKYKFELQHSSILNFKELDHIIPANSLADAVQKFTRKHDLNAPAYWDEPTYDRNIEMIFKERRGEVTYLISW